MTYSGDRPAIPLNRQTPPGRIPVPAIGRADPRGHHPSSIMEEMANIVYGDATTQSLLSPEILHAMPQWALALMNQNRQMAIELSTFYALLVRRGLITPAEVSTLRREIQQEHDRTFQKMVEQLGRQMKQAPTSAPPDDPRRNPT